MVRARDGTIRGAATDTAAALRAPRHPGPRGAQAVPAESSCAGGGQGTADQDVADLHGSPPFSLARAVSLVVERRGDAAQRLPCE